MGAHTLHLSVKKEETNPTTTVCVFHLTSQALNCSECTAWASEEHEEAEGHPRWGCRRWIALWEMATMEMSTAGLPAPNCTSRVQFITFSKSL